MHWSPALQSRIALEVVAMAEDVHPPANTCKLPSPAGAPQRHACKHHTAPDAHTENHKPACMRSHAITRMHAPRSLPMPPTCPCGPPLAQPGARSRCWRTTSPSRPPTVSNCLLDPCFVCFAFWLLVSCQLCPALVLHCSFGQALAYPCLCSQCLVEADACSDVRSVACA